PPAFAPAARAQPVTRNRRANTPPRNGRFFITPAARAIRKPPARKPRVLRCVWGSPGRGECQKPALVITTRHACGEAGLGMPDIRDAFRDNPGSPSHTASTHRGAGGG